MTKKVLFDFDTGCDDAIMLLMAIASERIEPVGISTVSGNAPINKTTNNTLSILEFANRNGFSSSTEIPVARGCDRSLLGEVHTSEEVHESDGLNGARSRLPDPSQSPVDEHAVQFILNQVQKHGSELTIAAVGPLTNIATAISIEPDLRDKINNIILLGGNMWQTGTHTPAATFNFFADAVAAKRVFRDMWPMMVGMEVWNRAPIPRESIDRYLPPGEISEVIKDIMDYAPENNSGEIFLPDPTVVAHLIGDVIDFEERYLGVDASGGEFHGGVMVGAEDRPFAADYDSNSKVGVEIDIVAYNEIIEETLSKYVN